ncbi:hypothetical protein DSO57_1020373 [Entomophthora muscae]|uniref:Uncharacterized protein n=1 Tax=Entomophthora muscae TaxID=34485 RepID=A0ACC2UDB5_9FUNG|nr:hypothetical protein DSO57_1020373 [Entomophthora muscae]
MREDEGRPPSKELSHDPSPLKVSKADKGPTLYKQSPFDHPKAYRVQTVTPCIAPTHLIVLYTLLEFIIDFIGGAMLLVNIFKNLIHPLSVLIITYKKFTKGGINSTTDLVEELYNPFRECVNLAPSSAAGSTQSLLPFTEPDPFPEKLLSYQSLISLVAPTSVHGQLHAVHQYLSSLSFSSTIQFPIAWRRVSCTHWLGDP